MKKNLFIVINLILLISLGVCGSLDYLNSGEYAFYLDKRGYWDFFRGYLFLSIDTGDYVVFCRNLNLLNNKQMNYMVQLGDRDGELQVIKTEGLTDTTPLEYMQGLVDFLNHNQMYQINKDKIGFGDFFEDEWENYILLYYYNKILPFFRFLDITKKGEIKPAYILNSAGILSENNIMDFFEITPITLSEKVRNVESLIIPEKKTMKVIINGLSVELDENWVYNDEIGSPGYWLDFNSYRDSQITVEVIPENFLKEKNLTIEELCRLSILSSQKVDYGSITGLLDKNTLYVTFSSFDSNDIRNYQVFIAKNDKQIINFSTFSDVFDANEKYYKEIFDKIVK